MKKTLEFAINGKLEIIWDDGLYKSDIQNITEKYLSISIPIKEGKYIPLRIGERISALYYDEDNSIYKFNTEVIGRTVDGVPLIHIELPYEFVKVQRRNFVRIPVLIDVECALIKINEKPLESGKNNIEFFDALSIDLSGGGIKIVTNKEINCGDKLIINISLEDESVSVEGKVVRITKNEDKNNVCGITFINMDKKTREKIIKYVFKVMRIQTKRTLKGD